MDYVGPSRFGRTLSPRPYPYELGHPVAISFLLGRNEAAGAGMTAFIAYHSGLEFALTMFFFDPNNQRTPLASLHEVTVANVSGTALDGEQFRLTVTFSDGSSVDSSTVGPFREKTGQNADTRTLTLLEGTGGGARSHIRWFVSPMPPPGRIAFSCDWPAMKIAWRREVDVGDQLQAAAEKSQYLNGPTKFPSP